MDIQQAIQEFEDHAYHHSNHPVVSDEAMTIALKVMREVAQEQWSEIEYVDSVAKYIRRNTLLSRFTYENGNRIPEVDADNFPTTMTIRDVKKMIREVPAADVAPVVHREILFRGKRTDNGEWIEGDLMQDPDLETAEICGWEYSGGGYEVLERGAFAHRIDTSTVGQYTGESDMHGTRAYEGDVIVPGGYKPDSVTGIIRFSGNRPDTSGRNRKEIGFWVEWQGDYSQQLRDDLGYWLPKSRVIGNIHDGKDGQDDEL